MTSRQRIQAAINHKEPDKLPIDCGSMRSTGIMAMPYNSLKKHLQITEGSTKVYDAAQQLAIPEQWYLDKFKVDSVDLARAYAGDDKDWSPWNLPDGSRALLPKWLHFEQQGKDWVCIDSENDIIGRMPEGIAYFTQTIWPYMGIEKSSFPDLGHAIGKTMWGYISDPLWKNEGSPDFYKQLQEKAKTLKETTDYASMIGFGGSLFEMGQFLYRTDELLMNLLLTPDEMGLLFDNLVELHLEKLEKVLGAINGQVDVIQFGDDFGTQSSLMINPETYRQIIYPRQKKLFSYVHDHSDLKVFLHSCGAINSIIPDLIDAGVDIINPVQIGADGMDPVELKREYGKDIVFWGGAIDTQHRLPKATPQEVRDDVKKNSEILMKDGGFVFNQVHNIVDGVPPENIVAMYEAANEITY